MKVDALKELIKQAVKEAINELKEEQLQEKVVPSPFQRELESIKPTSGGYVHDSSSPLTLEQAMQQTRNSLTTEDVRSMVGTGVSAPNFNYTSANAQHYSTPSTEPTSGPSSKMELDMMKKSAAIVNQMKESGKLGK